MGDRSTDLIARARAGQAEALGELCDLYRNYLRMMVRTGMGVRLRERVELSDVVQETLVEVVRQFPQFTGRDEIALVGWLRRLVAQRLVDLARYHGRAKRAAAATAVSLDAPWDGGAGLAPDGSSPRLLDELSLSQTSPSEAAGRRELIVVLADALADLPEPEAEILWLYHAEGLTFKAIERRLGLGRKSIRALWARGLRRIRRRLDPEPGPRTDGLPG
jgi:RNA polymerase sigma-70 factor (ECF subfamily)